MRRLITLLLTVLLAMTVCTINVTAEENQKTLTLDVTYVVENTLPEISGAKDKTIFVGEKFDALQGISATDAEDGNLKVNVAGEVNINKAGKYEITYSTSDNDGGTVSQAVTITVIERLIDSKDTVIETDTKVETGSPVTTVSTEMNSNIILESLVREEDDKENKSSELTAPQKQAIKDGANVSIDLVVNESSATDEDEKKIEQKVKDNNSDTQIGILLDISLLCTVIQNNSIVEQPSKITSTSEPVKVTVTVPDTLVNTDSTVTRDYDVARLHDGKVDLLGAKYDAASKKLTFDTSLFSTYAIVYTDTKVEQPKNNASSSSSSSGYKKPVVNTAPVYNLTLDNKGITIVDGKATTNLNVTDLDECEVLTLSYEPTLTLKSSVTGETVESKVSLTNRITNKGDFVGKYPLTVTVDNSKKHRPGTYKGTMEIIVTCKEYEARIGDEYYDTLQEAVERAISRQTIILLKNIEVSSVLEIIKSLTLNLNGYSITNNVEDDRMISVVEAIDFTIDGTKNNSLVIIPDSNSNSYGFIKVNKAADITLIGGNYIGNTNNGALIKVSSASENENAPDVTLTLSGVTAVTNRRVLYTDTAETMTVNVAGGSYTATATVDDSNGVYSVFGIDCYSLDAPISFSGVTINTSGGACVETSGCNTTYEDCNFSISGTSNPSFVATAVAVSCEGTATIKDGTYVSQGYGAYVYSSGGVINVEGGAIVGGITAVCANVSSYYENDSIINISGGTVDGQILTVGTGANAAVYITGGIFTTNPSAYVASGYVTLFEDNDYLVVANLSVDEEGSYLINNEKDLALFEKLVNKGGLTFNNETVKLMADIDLQGIDWTSIGQTGATQFMGTFDGGNHTISNLKISNTDEGGNCSTGLFGWLNNATVKNMVIDGATVSGHHNVGVIAGYLETSGCTIDNCHVLNATITCTSVNDDANGDKCGGIVGHAGNSGVSVKNCTVSNSNISAGRDAGQAVGAANTANVAGCSATNVNVSANGTSTGANIRNEVIGREL